MTQKLDITLTAAALNRGKELVKNAKNPEEILGIRLGIKTGGCNGLTYEVSYATNAGPTDLIHKQNGLQIVVDEKAALFLIGTVMDYVEEDLYSGFKFTNPNAKSACGCGESFTV